MTGRLGAPIASVLAAVLLGGCGASISEVAIETPIQPKLDITAFQRVLIAGFVAGGSDDVDANLETVRLLRSQLRSKSGLRVIEADVLPLEEIARDQAREAGAEPDTAPANAEDGVLPEKIQDE